MFIAACDTLPGYGSNSNVQWLMNGQKVVVCNHSVILCSHRKDEIIKFAAIKIDLEQHHGK